MLPVESVVSDSVRPHRRQPTRLCRSWDSPGKNTGVGCHFLLQCMQVNSEREVAESCLTLSDPMDYSPPGSTVHGIPWARTLGWAVITLSRGSSPSKDQNHVSCVAGRFFTMEPPGKATALSRPSLLSSCLPHSQASQIWSSSVSSLSLPCLPWRCFPAPWTMLSNPSQPLSSPLTCQQHLRPKTELTIFIPDQHFLLFYFC